MTETEQSFDPTQYIMKYRGGRDYLEVKWRIVWFRDVYPNGVILTEVLQHDPVVVQATVYSDPDTILSQGIGSPKQKGVASDRPYEGAETAAIGRALAHGGFGTQFTGETETEENLPDSPVERKSTPKPMSVSKIIDRLIQRADKYKEEGVEVNDAQRKLCLLSLQNLFIDNKDEYRHELTKKIFGKESLSDLHDGQIKALLDWLRLEEVEQGKYIPSSAAIADANRIIQKEG